MVRGAFCTGVSAPTALTDINSLHCALVFCCFIFNPCLSSFAFAEKVTEYSITIGPFKVSYLIEVVAKSLRRTRPTKVIEDY